MSMQHPVSRKRIQLVVLVLNTITSVIRPLLFPGQPWYFYVILFFATFIVITLLWECMLILSSFLENRIQTASRPVTRIVVQVLLTFVCTCILGYSFFGFAEYYYNVKNPPALEALMPVLFFMSAVIFNLIYFGAYYFSEWKSNFIRVERLQREQTEVRYEALRNQLNPHFLFNALTSLNSLIFENQQLASDFLQQLSKVYRYTLQHKNKETVSLKTELDFVQNYIALFKIRFEEAIIFNLEVSESDKEKGIPPVTLQMLIENAVKHNIISTTEPLTITIKSKDDYLIIENNINRKKQVESSNKQGLENLIALYKYLSDNPVIINESEKLFEVRIPLV